MPLLIASRRPYISLIIKLYLIAIITHYGIYSPSVYGILTTIFEICDGKTFTIWLYYGSSHTPGDIHIRLNVIYSLGPLFEGDLRSVFARP